MDEDRAAAEWAAQRRLRKYGVAAVLMGVATVLLLATVLMGQHGAVSSFGVFAVMTGSMTGMWLKEHRAGAARAASGDD